MRRKKKKMWERRRRSSVKDSCAGSRGTDHETKATLIVGVSFVALAFTTHLIA